MMPENDLSRGREHFHRSVWQRIPRSVRRKFLFRLSAMAAPSSRRQHWLTNPLSLSAHCVPLPALGSLRACATKH